MYRYEVKGMSCGGCAAAVERAVKRVDAGARVHVDLRAGEVSVESGAAGPEIGDAIRAAGYETHPLASPERD